MTLVLTLMFKFQIRKKGKMANVKSLTTEMALYKNVRPMITSTLMHIPPSIFLFQKKLMGVHWNSYLASVLACNRNRRGVLR
jgi:hypothetical protein